MNKSYHFEFPLKNGERCRSVEFSTIEDCIDECKKMCQAYGIDYDDREVMLFLTDDFGETYEECTEEGELAG